MLAKSLQSGRLIPLTLLALSAGCAVNDPPILERAGSYQGLTSVEIVATEDAGPVQAAFREAIIAEFSQHEVSILDGAPSVVELSISSRSADIAILPSEPSEGGDIDLTYQSDARKSRWYESCDAERLRAQLAVFERTSGKLGYRAVAQSDHCQGEPQPIAQLAQMLVADVMGKTPIEPAAD